MPPTMSTDLLQKLILLLAFFVLSVLSQLLLEKRERHRAHKTNHVGPDPTSLASLYDARQICIHPDHNHSWNKSSSPIKKDNRNLVNLYLKAIEASPGDEPLPLNLLQEVARLHYCYKHIKDLESDVISDFVKKWHDELLDRAAALSPSKMTLQDINGVLIPGGFPSMPLDTAEAEIISNESVEPQPLSIPELMSSAPERSEPLIVVVDQVTTGSTETGLSSASLNQQPKKTRRSLSPRTGWQSPTTRSTPKKLTLNPMKQLSPGVLHRVIFKALSKEERTEGTVYVLRREGCDSYFKVGFTRQPHAEFRVEQIRSECDVHYDVVGFWAVPNAKRVEKLILTEYQLSDRRFDYECLNSRGPRSTCAKTHTEIVQDDVEGVKRCVKHWVNWMTLCRPEAGPNVTPYHEESGEVKFEWVRHVFKPEPQAACEDCHSRFCFTSQGEPWLHRAGTKPPGSTFVARSVTPTPSRSPTPNPGASSGSKKKPPQSKQRAKSTGSVNFRSANWTHRPQLQSSNKTDPHPTSSSGSPAPP